MFPRWFVVFLALVILACNTNNGAGVKKASRPANLANRGRAAPADESTAPGDLDFFRRRMVEAYRRSDYRGGYTVMRDAVAAYPTDAQFAEALCIFAAGSERAAEAVSAGETALRLGADSEELRAALARAFLALGAQAEKNDDHAAARRYYRGAWEASPDDEWSANAYGYSLRETHKRRFADAQPQKAHGPHRIAESREPCADLAEALRVLSAAARRYPDNEAIRANLVWTLWEAASEIAEAGEGVAEDKRIAYNDAAYPLLARAEKLAADTDAAVARALLYKLPQIGRHLEAARLAERARRKFSVEKDGLFEPLFWQQTRLAAWRREQGDAKGMAIALDAAGQLASGNDREWRAGVGYAELARREAFYATRRLLDDQCPYFGRLDAAGEKIARGRADDLDKSFSKRLKFAALEYRGGVEYRVGNRESARRLLNDAYAAWREGAPSGVRKSDTAPRMPFPLAGYAIAGGNQSAYAITHMGMNQYCYDISGTLADGGTLLPGTAGKQNGDFAGFGRPVRATLAGTIGAAVADRPDAPPADSPDGAHGNYLEINAGAVTLLYYHLRQNSLTVKTGDRVAVGQVVAQLGNSASSRPHLHFCAYRSETPETLLVRFDGLRLAGDRRSVEIPGGLADMRAAQSGQTGEFQFVSAE